MAYPYYNPYPQNYYQQTTNNQPIYSTGIIWVNNKTEADFYPLAPNNAIALWDRAGTSIYLKQADATGKPSMKVYDLVERAETASNASEVKGDKTVEYATKSDLSAVVGVVEGFDELIGSLKGEIDSLKTDMYGIAGKKKTTTKKAKVEEEEE